MAGAGSEMTRPKARAEHLQEEAIIIWNRPKAASSVHVRLLCVCMLPRAVTTKNIIHGKASAAGLDAESFGAAP